MITRSMVSDLKQGQTLYSNKARNADGTALRARITSIKTWVRRPTDFAIKVARGMYEHGTITPDNAGNWSIVEPPALDLRRGSPVVITLTGEQGRIIPSVPGLRPSRDHYRIALEHGGKVYVHKDRLSPPPAVAPLIAPYRPTESK